MYITIKSNTIDTIHANRLSRRFMFILTAASNFPRRSDIILFIASSPLLLALFDSKSHCWTIYFISICILPCSKNRAVDFAPSLRCTRLLERFCFRMAGKVGGIGIKNFHSQIIHKFWGWCIKKSPSPSLLHAKG